MTMKVSISFSTLVPILLLWLSLAPTIVLAFKQGNFTRVLCNPTERDALLKLKHDLTDPSNRLASWVGDGDCCRWFGIVCHNVTGHVMELNLRSLSFQEYVDAFPAATAFTYGTAHHHEDYERFLLSGKINPSLINLKHLMHLDLSNNHFGGIRIPKFIGSLGSLKYLNLSGAGFGGMIPHQLGNLSNLHYLSLSGHSDYEYSNFYVENLDWVSGLSSLEVLDLSYGNLNKSFDWLEVMSNALPSLVQLHLSQCQLPQIPPVLVNVNFSSLSILDLSYNENCFNGFFPNFLQNLTSLRELDLSFNQFDSSIPNWLYSFSRLELLNLGLNNLQGEVSNAIGNMTSLFSLNLSYNSNLKFNRGIPESFKNLCNLKVLSLSYLTLNRDIVEVFEILLGCVSDKLESLDLIDSQLFGSLTSHVGQFKNLASLELNDNQLNGSLPDCFGGLKKLRVLDISYNFISGPMPMSFGELASLKTLRLHNNRFNGTLPASFKALTKLEEVYISSNLLVGDVFEFHFANLTKLQTFYAGGNQLILRVSPIDWTPPLHLKGLSLRSWNIGPQFPTWLHSLKYLIHLDLSSSSISSTVPAWFWNFSSQLEFLNLSNNQIHGVIPNNLNLDFLAPYPIVDLSSNNFNGSLPFIFSDVYSLNLSNNSFLGSIINFLCHKMHEVMKNMRFLNLGENLLSKEIPDCWMSWQYLEVIKLSNNRFKGNIPKSLGTLSSLVSLNFHNNSLSGELPESLKNCTTLVTLDIGENELTGNIPIWMGERLSNMVVINMRANKFHGHIPKELCNLAALQILDLAHNYLSGNIPTCVYNFSAMATRDDYDGHIVVPYNVTTTSYSENLLLMMKGVMAEYSTILGFVRMVDLSNNTLYGEIPTEITRLRELLSLNLSHNFLTGRIPKDIGAMRSLECIDFSLNKLSGKIPPSMSSLTFLNHLNLSNNKLWGEIPLGTQLQSFDASSFMANELCGPPLSKKCSRDPTTQDTKNGRNEGHSGMKINWFYISMAVGFIVGFWSIVGPLLFNRRCIYVYFHFLDRLWDKIWWHFHVNFIASLN